MTITKDTAVTLDYRITDPKGKLDAGTTAYLHVMTTCLPRSRPNSTARAWALALAAADAFGARAVAKLSA